MCIQHFVTSLLNSHYPGRRGLASYLPFSFSTYCRIQSLGTIGSFFLGGGKAKAAIPKPQQHCQRMITEVAGVQKI